MKIIIFVLIFIHIIINNNIVYFNINIIKNNITHNTIIIENNKIIPGPKGPRPTWPKGPGSCCYAAAGVISPAVTQLL